MTNAPRFRLLAALILLPVVVLAVLAGIGLREQKNSLRAEAQQLCNAPVFAKEWAGWLEAAAEASPRVVLYDDPPVPRKPGYQSEYLHAIEKREDIAGLREKMIANDADSWFMDSGLPVCAVAGWQWYQLALKAQNGDQVQSADFHSDVGYFVRIVTVTAPSVLTPNILEKLAEQFPDSAPEWRAKWQRNEMRRAALRFATGDHPAAGSPVQAIALPLKDPAFASPEPPGGGNSMAARIGDPPKVAMVFPRIQGYSYVLFEDELREKFRWVWKNATPVPVPAWAAVNVRIKPMANASFSAPPGLVSLGEEIRDVLSAEDMGFCIVEIGPRDPDWILRDYYRLVWWAAGLIGAALVTAGTGLWLVHRTLERERKLGEMKSQFVSSVSHELRAPVGSMRLMAEALASGKVSGPPADEFHRLMASEGARLSGLIENVLDFARIDQGRRRYHFAETDVTALVQDAVKLMTPPAEERGQKILTDIQPLSFVPQVDAPALQQALINLLENALKFSPPQSEVRVSLAGDPSRNTWSLSMADHGPGIAKAEHSRIFERFYRPGDELRRETTGTGIGLTIVKHVVEGHGGRILLHSEPGKGSTFTMEFPASRS